MYRTHFTLGYAPCFEAEIRCHQLTNECRADLYRPILFLQLWLHASEKPKCMVLPNTKGKHNSLHTEDDISVVAREGKGKLVWSLNAVLQASGPPNFCQVTRIIFSHFHVSPGCKDVMQRFPLHLVYPCCKTELRLVCWLLRAIIYLLCGF